MSFSQEEDAGHYPDHRSVDRGIVHAPDDHSATLEAALAAVTQPHTPYIDLFMHAKVE